MQNNIAAHTAVGLAPSFVSLNDVDGKFELHVRQAVREDMSYGDQVSVKLPLTRSELLKFAIDILHSLIPEDLAPKEWSDVHPRCC